MWGEEQLKRQEGYSRALLGFSGCSYKATSAEKEKKIYLTKILRKQDFCPDVILFMVNLVLCLYVVGATYLFNWEFYLILNTDKSVNQSLTWIDQMLSLPCDL